MDIGMRNYMEDIIMDNMPSVLEHMDVCQCERCKMDILAFVLNQVPPKYVVTKKGKIYAKLAAIESQFDADIVASITRAAAIVKENPRHDEDNALSNEQIQEE